MAHQPTYMFIPPPPLPEFYLSRGRRNDQSSSTSSGAKATDGADKFAFKGNSAFATSQAEEGAYGSRHEQVLQAPPVPLVRLPPPPPPTSGYPNRATAVPPLAVYHVCRICLRPRSPRYHREHPIPIAAVPPPPGICRRCRVTSVEEKLQNVSLVLEEKSGDVKLGVKCLVPDEDIVSHDQMQRRQVESVLRESSTERHRSKSRSRKELVYRHVRGVDRSTEEPVQSRRIKTTYIVRDAVIDSDEDVVSQRPTVSQTTTKPTASSKFQTSEKTHSTPARPTKNDAAPKSDYTQASISTQQPYNFDLSQQTSSAKAKEIPIEACKNVRSEFEIRQIAREEVVRFGEPFHRPGPTDSHIRKIAREEVEHYRKAERKLSVHPDPYVHGRMVPVQHRIEAGRDADKPKPWLQSAIKEESTQIHSKVSKPGKTPVKQRLISTSSGEEDSGQDFGSESTRWPYKISADRRRSERANATLRDVNYLQTRKEAIFQQKPKGDERFNDRTQETNTIVRDGGREYQKRSSYVAEEESKHSNSRHGTTNREGETKLPFQHDTPQRDSTEPVQQTSFRRTPVQIDKYCLNRTQSPEDISEGSGAAAQSYSKEEPSVGTFRLHFGKSAEAIYCADSRSSEQWDTSVSGGTHQKSKAEPEGTEPSVRSKTRDATKIHTPEKSEVLPVADRSPTGEHRRRQTSQKSMPYRKRVVYPGDSPSEEGSTVLKMPQDKQSPERHQDPEYIYIKRTARPAYRPLGNHTSDERISRHSKDIEDYLKSKTAPLDPGMTASQPWLPGRVNDDPEGCDVSSAVPHRRASATQYHVPPRRTGEDVVRIIRDSKSTPKTIASRRGIPPSYIKEEIIEIFERQPLHCDRAGHSSRCCSLCSSKECDCRTLPDSEYIVKERWITPADAPLGSRPPDDIRPKQSGETNEYRTSRNTSTRRPPSSGQHPRDAGHGDQRGRQPQTFNHVHFCSKVDISPTPPGSDASSSAFRSFHSFGRGNNREIDGHDGLGGGSGWDSEHERRGRGRSRDLKEAADVTYDRDETVRPRRSGKGPRQLQDIRRLSSIDRALSESPSRESLTTSFVLSDANPDPIDGYGPYREEERTRSLDVSPSNSPRRRDRKQRAGRDVAKSYRSIDQILEGRDSDN